MLRYRGSVHLESVFIWGVISSTANADLSNVLDYRTVKAESLVGLHQFGTVTLSILMPILDSEC